MKRHSARFPILVHVDASPRGAWDLWVGSRKVASGVGADGLERAAYAAGLEIPDRLAWAKRTLEGV